MIEVPKRGHVAWCREDMLRYGLVEIVDTSYRYTPLGAYVLELVSDEVDQRDKEWIDALLLKEQRLQDGEKLLEKRDNAVLNNEGDTCTKRGNKKCGKQRNLVLPALIGGFVGSLFYMLIKFLLFCI